MTNHCGHRGGLRFWGGSRILDPFGREIARAGDGPALITGIIDHDDVRLARFRLPPIRDADPGFVYADLGRLLPTGDDHTKGGDDGGQLDDPSPRLRVTPPRRGPP